MLWFLLSSDNDDDDDDDDDDNDNEDDDDDESEQTHVSETGCRVIEHKLQEIAGVILSMSFWN